MIVVLFYYIAYKFKYINYLSFIIFDHVAIKQIINQRECEASSH